MEWQPFCLQYLFPIYIYICWKKSNMLKVVSRVDCIKPGVISHHHWDNFCTMAPGGPAWSSRKSQWWLCHPGRKWKWQNIIIKVLLCIFRGITEMLLLRVPMRHQVCTNTHTSRAHYFNLSWWPTMPQRFPSAAAAAAAAALLSLLRQLRLVHYRCLQSQCVSPPAALETACEDIWEDGKRTRPPPPCLPLSSCTKVNLILSCNQRVTLMKPQQAQHLIRVKSKLTLKIFAHISPFFTHTLWIQWSRTSIHSGKGGRGGWSD